MHTNLILQLISNIIREKKNKIGRNRKYQINVYNFEEFVFQISIYNYTLKINLL